LPISKFDVSKRSRTTTPRAASPAPSDPAAFTARTLIRTPQDDGEAAQPFTLWPAQQDALAAMERERLLVILKARQLGVSWLACAYTLWLCATQPGRTVLTFSQGQLEANELIARVLFLADHHQDRAALPALVTQNTTELAWANGSRIKSLPATKRAGRSFTASLVILDEFAFMAYPADLYAAVKPTIDGGGKLFIISSADGQGTPYHRFWQAAAEGRNRFTTMFLPWTARPDRGATWRDERLQETAGPAAAVLREYPANPAEAFASLPGRIYDCFDEAVHTCPRFALPEDWPRYLGLDFGGVNTAGVFLAQEPGTGRLYLYRAYKAGERSAAEHAHALIAGEPGVPQCVGGSHSEGQWRREFRQGGLPVREPDVKEVEVGINRVYGAIKQDQLIVFDDCAGVLDELRSYSRELDGAGEPTERISEKSTYHHLDALRYIVGWLRRRQTTGDI
jgi:hypothetical protein